MEDIKKDILHSVYNINKTENLFYNKMKFINLSHLIQILDEVSDEQLETIKAKIATVEEELAKTRTVLDNLYIPTVELISAYDRTNFVAGKLA